MKIPYLRKEQSVAVKRMKARGFSIQTDTATGIVMSRLDDAGFREKVRVESNGRIRWYKPRKANLLERQKLRHIKEKYNHLNVK